MFKADYDAVTKSAAAHGNKQVWITETGWPYTGPLSGQAVASVDNAKAYWDNVGCGMLFGKVNTWWYALVDGNPANKEQFDISDNLSTTPRFDLTCPPAGTMNQGNNGTGSTSTGGSTATGSTATASAGASSTAKPNAVAGLSVSTAGMLLSAIVGLAAFVVI